MKKKVYSYFINDSNQLCYLDSSTGKKRVLNGKFYIDKGNTLNYKVFPKKNWHSKENIPDKINLYGEWELNENHDLVLSLKENKNINQKKLKLRGKITNVKRNLFTFSIKSDTSFNKSKITYLKIKGKWKTDRHNRIYFEIKKKKDNKLFLKSSWEVDENNQISYEYEKLKTKSKEKFTIEGHWKIKTKNRIRYVLENAKDSYLDFKVYLETPNVYPTKEKIKYRVGVGIKRNKKFKTISLSGTWKFSRRLGLFFELDSKRKKIHRIKFKAQLTLAEKDKLIFSLYTRTDIPVGVGITFLKHHPQISNKDFEYFLRLKKEGGNPEVEVGGRIRF